jgi:hypothetical protein
MFESCRAHPPKTLHLQGFSFRGSAGHAARRAPLVPQTTFEAGLPGASPGRGAVLTGGSFRPSPLATMRMLAVEG